MKVTIQSIHFDAKDALKQYVQDKCNKLDRYYDGILSGSVSLKLQQEVKQANKLVEIRLQVPGDILMASQEGQTFEEATDLVTDKLKEQIKRYKERQHGHA
ncbi:MAG: ribosome-associated translation inhibitor RaiA [Bacteroidia bacterium]|nr:ribosome-associated translation inhibitor RaiA [Bacteroidia bacterium]